MITNRPLSITRHEASHNYVDLVNQRLQRCSSPQLCSREATTIRSLVSDVSSTSEPLAGFWRWNVPSEEWHKVKALKLNVSVWNAPRKKKERGDLAPVLWIWMGQVFVRGLRVFCSGHLQRRSASSVGNGVELGAQLLLLGWDRTRSLGAVCLFKPDRGPAPAKTCLFVDGEVN